MTGKSPDEMVHVVDPHAGKTQTFAICGARLIRHDGEDRDVVTCLDCATGLTQRCGHASATVRNCPAHEDYYGDPNQRCKCCDACAHSCAQDV